MPDELHECSMRDVRDSDGELLFELHIASIQTLCARSYTSEQIAAWTEGKRPEMYRPPAPDHFIRVAEQNEQLVGFGHLAVGRGVIVAVYVHPDHIGFGYGRIIVDDLLHLARQHGLTEVTLHSSLNAEAFYARCGFSRVELTTHRFRSGKEVSCVLMRLSLTT